ncbi:hypothetical protein PR002_g23623 [Phytophthora rubi]|uniref:Crinkler effector protein N-terminal domain-containing protein n=1 Tax=Phytophthora rubi TaxID=129364 RepID=A0A6A3IPQ4_9STRA|nr:hypothetical protein PR002_g23623 [Phytophthora rubi]
MVNLFCGIVGVAGPAFVVDIDAEKTVGHLRKAIKTDNEDIKCPPRNLKLFLAKKGDAWLTEADVMKGVSDTTGLKPLDNTGAPLHLYDLSKKKLRFQVTKAHLEAKTTPVHVLAKLPDQGQQLGENVQDILQMQRQTQIEITRLQAQMELVMEALPHKNSKSYSDRELGQLELQRLEKDGLVFDVAPDENGTAFWSNEIQIEADAIGNEADLDAFITPYFSEVLHRCGMVFVNRERSMVGSVSICAQECRSQTPWICDPPCDVSRETRTR